MPLPLSDLRACAQCRRNPLAVQLVFHVVVHELATVKPEVARQYAGPKDAPAVVIEKIYLAALSRRPTKDELDRLTAYVAKANTPAEAYADIIWVVLNSSEFAMVR